MNTIEDITNFSLNKSMLFNSAKSISASTAVKLFSVPNLVNIVDAALIANAPHFFAKIIEAMQPNTFLIIIEKGVLSKLAHSCRDYKNVAIISQDYEKLHF